MMWIIFQTSWAIMEKLKTWKFISCLIGIQSKHHIISSRCSDTTKVIYRLFGWTIEMKNRLNRVKQDGSFPRVGILRLCRVCKCVSILTDFTGSNFTFLDNYSTFYERKIAKIIECWRKVAIFPRKWCLKEEFMDFFAETWLTTSTSKTRNTNTNESTRNNC